MGSAELPLSGLKPERGRDLPLPAAMSLEEFLSAGKVEPNVVLLIRQQPPHKCSTKTRKRRCLSNAETVFIRH